MTVQKTEPAAQAGGATSGAAEGEASKSLADFYDGGQMGMDTDDSAADEKQSEENSNNDAPQGDTGEGGEEAGESPGFGEDKTPPEKKDGEPAKKPDAGKDGGKEGDDYQPNIPDGFQVDAEVMGEFKTFAKENKLSGEQFQRAIDMQVKFEQKRNAAIVEQRAKLNADFIRELKADPDFGGAHHKESMDAANWAFRKFGDPELLNDLSAWGVKNHPRLVKMLARVGRAMRENKSPAGKPPAAAKAARGIRSLADSYRDMD